MTVDRDSVDFGDLYIGSVAPAIDRVVRLTNTSPVWTNWRLEHQDNDRVPQFFAKPKEGRLESGS